MFSGHLIEKIEFRELIKKIIIKYAGFCDSSSILSA